MRDSTHLYRLPVDEVALLVLVQEGAGELSKKKRVHFKHLKDSSKFISSHYDDFDFL